MYGRHFLTEKFAFYVKKRVDASVLEDVGSPTLQEQIFAALNETEYRRVITDAFRSVQLVAG